MFGLPRGALQLLRSSRFALTRPDAFISPGRQAVREADAIAGVRGRIPAPQLRVPQRLYMCRVKGLRMRLRRINRPKAAMITAKSVAWVWLKSAEQ